MQNPAKYERIFSLSLSLSLSLSFCLPSPPMFPEEELGDILFRSGIHRVGAALDF